MTIGFFFARKSRGRLVPSSSSVHFSLAAKTPRHYWRIFFGRRHGVEKSSRKSRRGTFLAAAGRLITSHNSRGLPPLLLFLPLFSPLCHICFTDDSTHRGGQGEEEEGRRGMALLFLCPRKSSGPSSFLPKQLARGALRQRPIPREGREKRGRKGESSYSTRRWKFDLGTNSKERKRTRSRSGGGRRGEDCLLAPPSPTTSPPSLPHFDRSWAEERRGDIRR